VDTAARAPAAAARAARGGRSRRPGVRGDHPDGVSESCSTSPRAASTETPTRVGFLSSSALACSSTTRRRVPDGRLEQQRERRRGHVRELRRVRVHRPHSRALGEPRTGMDPRPAVPIGWPEHTSAACSNPPATGQIPARLGLGELRAPGGRGGAAHELCHHGRLGGGGDAMAGPLSLAVTTYR